MRRTNLSLLDLVGALNRLLGKDIQPIFAPSRAGDVKHSRANISKARHILDFEPSVTFDDGLAKAAGLVSGCTLPVWTLTVDTAVDIDSGHTDSGH